jgi:hypothetical protein
MPIDVRVVAAEALLEARGADRIDHPGGTLLAHLHRVRDLLAAWEASPDVQLAGLCHAAYGTDGFPTALLQLDERGRLGETIGAAAEQLVYLYGSCNRAQVYPHLGERVVEFVDRFNGVRSTPAPPELRAFVEITAANELDVVRHNPELATRHGANLAALFARAERHLPPIARQAWAHQAIA